MLTAERLREVLHYDSETGLFTWKIKVAKNVEVGQIAGFVHQVEGYRRISIDNRQYQAHRLAFLYMTGAWPAEQIDHQNGIREDNRWLNLRGASHQTNQQNAKLRSSNKTGIHGVRWHGKQQTFHIYMNHARRRMHLGSSKDFFEACCIRKSAESEYGFHVNHGRIS